MRRVAVCCVRCKCRRGRSPPEKTHKHTTHTRNTHTLLHKHTTHTRTHTNNVCVLRVCVVCLCVLDVGGQRPRRYLKHLRPFCRGDVCICGCVVCVSTRLPLCVGIFVTRSRRPQTKHKEMARAARLSSHTPAHLHPRPPFDVGAAQSRVLKSHARVTRMQ